MKGFLRKVQKVKQGLWLNGYPKHFVDAIINKSGKKNYLVTQSKALYTIGIPYSKDIPEKLNALRIYITFRPLSKQKTLHNVFALIKPDNKSQQWIKNCIYSIPCDCG
jgi:hypothetical protein